jgi:hypothetical protein
MAENQARTRRTRNGAPIGGGHSGMDARESDSRLIFDERRTVAWRSLDPFVESYSSSPHDVPDWQPRD